MGGRLTIVAWAGVSLLITASWAGAVPLRLQPDLSKPLNLSMVPPNGTDTAAMKESQTKIWNGIPADIQPMSAYSNYNFDQGGLEKCYDLNLQVAQSIGGHMILEVNRVEPGAATHAQTGSEQWIDDQFKKYSSFVGVEFGITCNRNCGSGGTSTANLLQPNVITRIKSLLTVCGRNGGYFIMNYWNEGMTTPALLAKMQADTGLLAVMKQYHENIIIMNSCHIRCELGSSKFNDVHLVLKQMLKDGIIGRMGINIDGSNGAWENDFAARKADGYTVFGGTSTSYYSFLRSFAHGALDASAPRDSGVAAVDASLRDLSGDFPDERRQDETMENGRTRPSGCSIFRDEPAVDFSTFLMLLVGVWFFHRSKPAEPTARKPDGYTVFGGTSTSHYSFLRSFGHGALDVSAPRDSGVAAVDASLRDLSGDE